MLFMLFIFSRKHKNLFPKPKFLLFFSVDSLFSIIVEPINLHYTLVCFAHFDICTYHFLFGVYTPKNPLIFFIE